MIDLTQRIKALPAILDANGDECVSREVVLAHIGRRDFVGHLAGAAALAVAGGGALTISGCSVDWLLTAINALPTLDNVATMIAALVGGTPAAAAVAAIVQSVNSGIALVQSLIKSYQAQPSGSTLQNIQNALLDVQSNLGSILTAVHVQNIALRAAVAGVVGIALSAITEILSLMPANTTAVAAGKPAESPAAIKPRSAATIKKQVNGFLAANGYSKFALA